MLIWLGAGEKEIKAVLAILQKTEEVSPNHIVGYSNIKATLAKSELRESLEAVALVTRRLLPHP